MNGNPDATGKDIYPRQAESNAHRAIFRKGLADHQAIPAPVLEKMRVRESSTFALSGVQPGK